jgi:EAL and modified HD-GYP domain-containing signal transduction protein
MPIQEIVEALPLTSEVRDALLRFEGPYGEALASVIAYERGYFEEAQFSDLTPAQMSEAYLEAVSWESEATKLLRSPH